MDGFCASKSVKTKKQKNNKFNRKGNLDFILDVNKVHGKKIKKKSCRLKGRTQSMLRNE